MNYLSQTTNKMQMVIDDVQSNALLVTKNLPNGTKFGIDFQAFCVGDKFLGIKHIPPGPHFVFWEPRDSNGESSIPMGFFHYFQENEIMEREWDDFDEELREARIVEVDKQQSINYFQDHEQ